MKNSTIPTNRIRHEIMHKQKIDGLSDNTLMLEKAKNVPGVLKNLMISSGKAFIIAICAVVFFASCDTPSENVENEEENVTEANEDLDEARQEYTADVERFRVESERVIEENEREIEEINRNIQENNEEVNEEFEMKIAELEEKNRDLKRQIRDYDSHVKNSHLNDSNDWDAHTNENWEEFKSAFNEELNNLESELRDLTSENSVNNN